MPNAKNIIRQSTKLELESIHIEAFINNSQNKVTKVSDHSALRGLIRGNVETAKKALKDIVLAVSHLYPDLAFDSTLDNIAEMLGVAARFDAAQSSTWVRLVGDEGTFYQAGTNTVSDNKGNIFDLETDLTIGSKGYDYVKIRSQQSGASTNVGPYTLINIAPEPSGHIAVINEYGATGGRDLEDNQTFLQRIKEGPDILAQDTLSYLTQAFIKINSNVLRVVFDGIDQNGKVVISVLTVNGIDLNDDELNTLLEQGSKYFAFTELNPVGTKSYGVKLKNATYFPIDVDMRIELFTGINLNDVVIDIQQKFSKLVDFRFWESSLNQIQWDELLSIVRNTDGVKNVADRYFTPNVDIQLKSNEFPRFRGFIVRDLFGTVMISQDNEVINPVYYDNQVNVNLSETVL